MPKKERKTDNPNYHKEYREKNEEHYKQYHKTKYYKNKFNIGEEMLETYGLYTADVFKIKKTFDALVEKQPQLKSHILELLNKE